MTSPERALRAAQRRLHELEAEREVVAKDLGTAEAALGALVARGADTAELQGRVASFCARLTELDAGIPVARGLVGDAEREVAEAARRAAAKRARALAKKRDIAAARFDAAVRDMDSAWNEFAELARKHRLEATSAAISGAVPSNRLALMCRVALLTGAPTVAGITRVERLSAIHRSSLSDALAAFKGDEK